MPIKHRSKTLSPAQRLGRQYTDRRAAAAKKLQKLARSKAYKGRSKDVAKVNAKQAYEIALKAAIDVKEAKSFYVGDDFQRLFAKVELSGVTASVAVSSFCCTNNKESDGTTVRKYGGHDMHNLDMATPVDQATAATKPNLAGFVMDGKKCKPHVQRVDLMFQRRIAMLNTYNGSSGSATSYVPGFRSELIYACPVRVRIVRVVPKLVKGLSAEFDPDTDLFLDQYTNAQGVASNNFTTIDAQHSKVNHRKYLILQDEQFTLLPPTTANVSIGINNNWNSSQFNPNTAPTLACERAVTMRPQITAVKGGDLTYNVPSFAADDAGSKPSSGGRNEMVFMHAWYVCTSGLGTGPPDADPRYQPAPVVGYSERINSTFKDI